MENYSSIAIFVELHALCLFLLLDVFFSMRKGRNDDEQRMDRYLILVFFCCSIVVITDASWTVMDGLGTPGYLEAYLVNFFYFQGCTVGVAVWFLFCTRNLHSVLYTNRKLRVIVMLPALLASTLLVISAFNGCMFTFVDGVYVRGPLFFIDAAIKMLYLMAAIFVTVYTAIREKRKYKKKECLALLAYSIPITVGGFLQVATGLDFNCIGFTVGLLLLNSTGLSNATHENSEIVYALAGNFDASFHINADDHKIRTLRSNTVYNSSVHRALNLSDYEERIMDGLEKNIPPEERKQVLETFSIPNVVKRLDEENSFETIYQVLDLEGKIRYHRANFMRTVGRYGQIGFLLGISCLDDKKMEDLFRERLAAIEEKNKRLEVFNENIVAAAAIIVEARDEESGDHVQRVREFTRALARQVSKDYPEYNLDKEAIQKMASTSVLHDIGKIMIPDSVLRKKGRLDDEEYNIMKTHCVRGCEVLQKLEFDLGKDFLDYACQITRWHHERYDGKGYPDGLVGDAIPLAAQIVSIADVYEALTAKRVYKSAFTPEVAMDMIQKGKCGVFSPKLLASLKHIEEEFASMALDKNTGLY